MFQKFSKNKEAEIKKVVPGNKDFKRLLTRKFQKKIPDQSYKSRIREKRMNCTVRKIKATCFIKENIV